MQVGGVISFGVGFGVFCPCDRKIATFPPFSCFGGEFIDFLPFVAEIGQIRRCRAVLRSDTAQGFTPCPCGNEKAPFHGFGLSVGLWFVPCGFRPFLGRFSGSGGHSGTGAPCVPVSASLGGVGLALCGGVSGSGLGCLWVSGLTPHHQNRQYTKRTMKA